MDQRLELLGRPQRDSAAATATGILPLAARDLIGRYQLPQMRLMARLTAGLPAARGRDGRSARSREESEEGGRFELDEFLRISSSSSAIRCSMRATRLSSA
jgi:hypothetical protein